MKNESKTSLYGNDIPWEEADTGIHRQLLGYNDSIMMVRIRFVKGAVGRLHNHPHSQATYIAKGVFELEIEGEKTILREGDGYYIPPNRVHGVVCLEKGELIDTFSPVREDFLPK